MAARSSERDQRRWAQPGMRRDRPGRGAATCSSAALRPTRPRSRCCRRLASATSATRRGAGRTLARRSAPAQRRPRRRRRRRRSAPDLRRRLDGLPGRRERRGVLAHVVRAGRPGAAARAPTSARPASAAAQGPRPGLADGRRAAQPPAGEPSAGRCRRRCSSTTRPSTALARLSCGRGARARIGRVAPRDATPVDDGGDRRRRSADCRTTRRRGCSWTELDARTRRAARR